MSSTSPKLLSSIYSTTTTVLAHLLLRMQSKSLQLSLLLVQNVQMQEKMFSLDIKINYWRSPKATLVISRAITSVFRHLGRSLIQFSF